MTTYGTLPHEDWPDYETWECEICGSRNFETDICLNCGSDAVQDKE